VTPATAVRTSRPDYFGNTTEWLALYEPHTVIDISAESRVTALAPAEHDPEASEPWEDVRARLESMAPETHEIVQYIFDSPLTGFTADLPGYALKSFTPGRPLLAGALDLMSRIHEDFRYDTTVTDASTPVDRVFEIRAGVCQDLAHIGIAAMRSLGLPARYVSGYLLTKPPPGQERLVGADASHAWFAVWAPPFGWVDLDPTNDLIPGKGHITVAWGRDYSDVAPINGIVTGGGDHLIEVGVDVIPVE
jgi:transglutaminase-like putative cysteine protease